MNKLLTSCLLLSSTTAVAQSTEKPNIVILFVDDLGWSDLGYVNPKFETPNINQLKNDGLYFSRAYVSTATSSPSRASLLTAKDALRCGFVRHISNKMTTDEFQTLDTDPGKMKSRSWLPLEEVTYAERLKEYGYYNYFIGKWHLGPESYYPTSQGFDDTYGTSLYGNPANFYHPFFKENNPLADAKEGEYLTDKLTLRAEEFIKNYDKSQPFLLNMWYYTVHSPLIGRKDLVEKYTKQGFPENEANFAAMVESLDMSVGKIRNALEEKGIAENTIIIFTSDQGGYFRNGPLRGGKVGGDTVNEGGSRVPFIVYAPGATAMGGEYKEPMQIIDVYPTLIELASGRKCNDKWINGISLIPALEGGELKKRDLFLHRSYEDQHAAIIDSDWKLIKYRSGKLELYNITQDIGETINCVDTHPKIKKSLHKRLNNWLEEATPKELLQ